MAPASMSRRFLSTLPILAALCALAGHAGAADDATNASKAASASRRAVAAMQESDWASARRAWNEVVRLDAGNAGAWSNLGKVEHQLGDLKPATEKSSNTKPQAVPSDRCAGDAATTVSARPPTRCTKGRVP